MFNISPTELLLVAIVALIVIGPEKLPSTIRTASLWIGRFRRSFYQVKADIERELNTDEIRRQLHNESVLAEIEDAKKRVEDAAQDTKKSVENIVSSDDFDPGASAETAKQQAEAQIEDAKQELADAGKEIESAGKEIESAGKQLYGTGKNPRLASADDEADEEADSKVDDKNDESKTA